jgi:hypothetical protein
MAGDDVVSCLPHHVEVEQEPSVREIDAVY